MKDYALDGSYLVQGLAAVTAGLALKLTGTQLADHARGRERGAADRGHAPSWRDLPDRRGRDGGLGVLSHDRYA